MASLRNRKDNFMDDITKGFVEEFSRKYDLQNESLSDQFEYFSNFCIVSKEYNRTSFLIEETLSGDDTVGIDGMAVIVNNKVVNSTTEINDIIEMNGYLNANFVFIQSKTSSNFDNKEMLNFSVFVGHFFEKNTQLFKTEEMKKFLELKDYIYSKTEYMEERNPICNLYYVTTGKWVDDETLSYVINVGKATLDGTNLFDQVNYFPCDAKTIQKLYRKTKEQSSATFTFEKKVTLPPIPKVNVAYFGMLPFSEYKKIIIDESSKIKDVFDDNIRDYLGDDNDVNEAIQSTINQGKFDVFSILNNGVTVVADKIAGAGDTITISGYQVVNGCQTSHILFENREKIGIDNVSIPTRVIITTDDDIRSQITRATNNQTAVKKEELEALSEFQKNLETFYNGFPDEGGKLHYERRTNQYNSSPIPKTRIVNIHSQIKAFTAMFLENPHIVNGYYGTIAKKMGKRIFRTDHEYVSYYVSSLTYYKLDVLFRTGKLPREAKRMKYHILMLFRLKVSGKDVPEFNSKKIKRYCEPMINVLSDSEKTLRIFEDVITLITKSVDVYDRKTFERKEITDILLNVL